MVSNEKYMNFLKAIISCVNYGDYFSVKELSNFELEKIIKEEKRNGQEKNRIKRSRKMLERNIESLKDNETDKLKDIIDGYSKHILSIIEINRNIEELQKEVILIKEFIDKI